MDNKSVKKELGEAIDAGEQALNSLYKAKDCLESAKNWGIMDMFGGGMISSFMKHSKIDDASAKMENAKRSLKNFEKELRDVSRVSDLHLEVGEFLSFADFFFDSFFVDYMVQSKIKDAARQVDSAIQEVRDMVFELKEKYKELN